MSDELSIEELRDILAKQILKIAIEDDENPQLKIDVYKATAERGTKTRAKETATVADGMAIFQQRVRQATSDGGEPVTPDC